MSQKLKISIASDHAGYDLKRKIVKFINQFNDYEIIDFGPYDSKKANYAKYGKLVGESISKNESKWGIIICGSGIGISIAANRYKGARAGRIINLEDAKLARMHNDLNIISLGARTINNDEEALKIIEYFLKTKFEGGRHIERIEELDK